MAVDAPTREKPLITLAGGPLHVMRGYEVINAGTGEYEFIGAHDGPLIQLRGPHTALLCDVGFAPQIIEALQAAIVPPTGDRDAARAELEAMGYALP